MNPAITSCTIVGPGLKSRPMATYCPPSQQARYRAKREQPTQREAHERAELESVLASLDWEPRRAPIEAQPAAPEMPAKLALHQEQAADPILNRDFLIGLITGAAMASASIAVLFGGRP